MNWDAIGAIGQAVSAVALLFVVLQVWHPRMEMTRATRAARTDAWLGVAQGRIGDPLRMELRSRANQALGGTPHPMQPLLAERAGLTPVEASIVNFDQMILWQYYAEKVIRYSSELSPADLFQANATMRNMFSSPLGRLWFDTMKPSLNPDAVGYIENLLAKPPGSR